MTLERTVSWPPSLARITACAVSDATPLKMEARQETRASGVKVKEVSSRIVHPQGRLAIVAIDSSDVQDAGRLHLDMALETYCFAG
eukprot:scaffold2360_cov293-Pinguiococcus_pyrenoidosus.AAC.1